MFFLKRPERKKLLYLFWFSVLLSTLDLRVTIPTPTDSILFVVDVTMSMNSKDMSLDEQGEVSRVFFAKDTLKNSIKALQCGTEVGLGIFAGYQATILFQPIEVCANYSELIESIGYLDTNMIWAGDSEVSKGLYNALILTNELNKSHRLVFITDGHEAPPISPLYRPSFNGDVGAIKGIIFGVGGNKLVPIPKLRDGGVYSGSWKKDDVMQIDPFSAGRRGSDSSESLVNDPSIIVDPQLVYNLQATPGMEHLSEQKTRYLELLASEQDLTYLNLKTVDDLVDGLETLPFSEWRYSEVSTSRYLIILSLIFLLLIFWPLDGTFKYREYSHQY